MGQKTHFVVFCILAYFLYGFRNLYNLCQPPFHPGCPEGPGSGCLDDGSTPYLRTGHPLTLSFFLSHSPSPHGTDENPIFPIGSLDVPYGWDYRDALSKVVRKEKRIQIVDPMGEHHLEGEVPEPLMRNASVYLHVQCLDAVSLNPMLSPVSVLISRFSIPEKYKKQKRWLLKDPFGVRSAEVWRLLPNGEVPKVAAIPTFLEIGPVVEEGTLHVPGMMEKGLAHFLVKVPDGVKHLKGGEKAPGFLHRFPVHVNNFMFPRDEYAPLLSLSQVIESQGTGSVGDALRDIIDEDDRGKGGGQKQSGGEGGGGGESTEDWGVGTGLKIKIKYRPIGLAYMIFQHVMSDTFNKMEGVFDEYDVDSLKMTMTGTTPWLVAITFVVSVLHLIMEVLYVSSDIEYWKKQESFEGLSSLSILLDVICTVVIVLYLHECGESTLVIWIPLVRALLDSWKIVKMTRARYEILVVSSSDDRVLGQGEGERAKLVINSGGNKGEKETEEKESGGGVEKVEKEKGEATGKGVEHKQERGFSVFRLPVLSAFVPLILPTVIWRKRKAESEKEARKQEKLEELLEFEAKCMRWLSVFLLPVILCVCGYQLVFEKQRSWYSWLITSLASCAYAGGFVVMTPQLFRNYKLKSVEHLPWVALTYQAFNTFIDDLFSLLIRMPQMHRMSVFRDDVVFLIFIGQRFLYKRRKEIPTEEADDPPLSGRKGESKKKR